MVEAGEEPEAEQKRERRNRVRRGHRGKSGDKKEAIVREKKKLKR
jgi:hypothetical protein